MIEHASEIAANFKDQGNDYFKGKRYREALGFYTQGLEVKPSDVKITTALLCNRAACNLELRECYELTGTLILLSDNRKLRHCLEGHLGSTQA
jgi:hypothetical protein